MTLDQHTVHSGELVDVGDTDRARWNAKYARAGRKRFAEHPFVAAALAAGLPDRPVVDLACGPSGSALALAANGRSVTAVDISDVALGLLGEEAGRRRLGDRVRLVHADLARWIPPPGGYALVLCVDYWSAAVFAKACAAVAPGGLLAWEALALSETHPAHVRAEWCLRPGEPAALLPAGFEVLEQREVARHGRHEEIARRMIARRRPAADPGTPSARPTSGG